MSVQFAMMGMAVAGGVMSGLAAKGADEQQATGLREQADAMRVKGAEARLNASEQEQSMWSKALSLLSTNEAQAGNKGVAASGGDSGAVIQEHNLTAANTTASRIKFMGDTGGSMLDFGASNMDKSADYLVNTAGPMALVTGILGGAAKGASMMSWGKDTT